MSKYVDVCVCSGASPNVPCIFPFTYDGTIHERCTDDGNDPGDTKASLFLNLFFIQLSANISFIVYLYLLHIANLQIYKEAIAF